MADERRRYVATRSIFDYDAVVTGTGQQTIVCINRDVLPIIIELLSTRGLWRSSYYTSQAAQSYTIPNQDDFNLVDNIVSDAIYQCQRGITMANCNDLVTVIAGLGLSLERINAQLNEQTAVLVRSQCGCVGSGTNPVPQDLSEDCTVPIGFDDWSDWTDYGCRASGWLLDKIILAIGQIGQSYQWLQPDWISEIQQGPDSPSQVYQRLAQMQAAMIPLEWIYNLSDVTKAGLVVSMVDLYLRFRGEKYLRVPEVDTVEDVIEDWFAGAFNIASDMLANYDTIAQDLYDAATADDLLTVMSDAIADAVTYAQAQTTGLAGLDFVAEAVESLIDIGVAMLGFSKSPTIAGYTTTYTCTGDKACCPILALITGHYLGVGQYKSKLVSGVHTVDVISNAYAVGDHCSAYGEFNEPTAISGTPASVEFFDDANDSTGVVAWPISGSNCIRRMLITGSGEFTVDLSAVAVCT